MKTLPKRILYYTGLYWKAIRVNRLYSMTENGNPIRMKDVCDIYLDIRSGLFGLREMEKYVDIQDYFQKYFINRKRSFDIFTFDAYKVLSPDRLSIKSSVKENKKLESYRTSHISLEYYKNH